MTEWRYSQLIFTEKNNVYQHCTSYASAVRKSESTLFTLKCVCDMIRTYSQMHHTDKYSQHSSIIWPVWLNG